MRRVWTPSRQVIVAVCLALAGLLLVFALLWGPLHGTYEWACQIYPPFRNIGPVPFALLTMAVLASAALGIGSFLLGFIKSLKLSMDIHAARVSIPIKLQDVASNLGIRDKIVCITSSYPMAFCYGILRPMVCLSTSAVEKLEPAELEVVIAHERVHLKSRDPMRLLLGRSLSRALFLVPHMGDIYRGYVLRRELRADKESTSMYDRIHIASAILKMGATDTKDPNVVSGFNLLEERVRHLISDGNNDDKSVVMPWARVAGQVMVLTGLAFLGIGLLARTAEAAVVGCLL